MHSSKSRYTKAQLAHCGVLIEQSDNFDGIPGVPDSLYDEMFLGKFRDIVRTIYTSENPVSLCNNVVFGLSENCSSDVVAFVNNWLLKSVPAIKSAPDDETAFKMLIPRSAGSLSEIAPYVDFISSFIDSDNLSEPSNNSE